MSLTSRVIGMTIYYCLRLPIIISTTQVLPWLHLRQFMGEDVGLHLGGLKCLSFLLSSLNLFMRLFGNSNLLEIG